MQMIDLVAHAAREQSCPRAGKRLSVLVQRAYGHGLRPIHIAAFAGNAQAALRFADISFRSDDFRINQYKLLIFLTGIDDDHLLQDAD